MASLFRRSFLWTALYLALLAACVGSLAWEGDLSLGRQPWRNIKKTATEMARPSFFDIWWGNPKFEYRNDEGQVLRTEDRRVMEWNFFAALLRAAWMTIQIATVGSFLGSVLAFPLGIFAARNIKAPRVVAILAKLILDCSRSIHTLVFGLILVGIVGLGPMAGILAIAAHCLGTFGKLYAETIETLDMDSVNAVRAVGASEIQIFFNAVWPAILPQLVSTNLYVWEYNIRDSTILGLVGAGGIGLLLNEATSLFQWARLATILLVIVGLVSFFDGVSRIVRQQLL